MKNHTLLILALCGSATFRASAQEVPPFPPAPPAPLAPPTPPVRPNRHQPRIFLGVEVGPVPTALSEQLNLPEGFGVLVEYVVPGSAADTAGVKANDVLKTLDGQIVTSSRHLAVLVRSFADGQEVPLVVLHKGQETKLTAKLQKKDARNEDQDGPNNRHVFDDPFERDFHFDFDDPSSPEFQKQLRKTLERSQAQVNAATRRALDESRQALDEARERTARAFASRTDYGHARVVLRDPTGRIELRVVHGKRTLKVRDEKGETVFEGPINTPEQRKTIPADVLPQVEALEHEQETAFSKDSENDDD